MARKLRQVVDLYSGGKTVVLKGDTPVWVQPLNPFEQDTARSEAQVARTRLAMAIRTEGSNERDKVRVWFDEDGRDAAVDRLTASRVSNQTNKMIEAIRNDSDWKERMDILDRGAEDTAKPLEEAEEKLLTRIGSEFAAELGKRIQAERDYQLDSLSELSDEDLWEEYLDWYVNERTSDVLMAEFRLHQVYFGTRWCEGTTGEDDGEAWDHSNCEGHRELVFESKEDARTAPADLLELLYLACDEVDMTARDAKNSRRQGSSSDSSPLPSEAGESTPSTQNETPPEPHGSSSSQSATRSPSLAGAS